MEGEPGQEAEGQRLRGRGTCREGDDAFYKAPRDTRAPRLPPKLGRGGPLPQTERGPASPRLTITPCRYRNEASFAALDN